MSVEIEKRPRIRIVSGAPALVEHDLNRLLDDYAVTVWNWAVVNNQLTLSAILIHQAELRKAQLAAAPMMMPPGRH